MREQREFTNLEPGQRLDVFVVDQLAGRHSRSEVQRWIQDGAVTVNEQASKPGRRLEQGDVVRVWLPMRTAEAVQPWQTPLCILYEDADCIVVDKPAGMVVHPATSHRQDTLVNALLARYPDMAAMVDPRTEEGRRPGIVHRLDRDTSGLIVVARHAAARATLQSQFKSKRVEKVYVALLHGHLSPPEGLIEAPIGRDPRQRKRMAVVPDGRAAATRYTALQFLLTPHGSREPYTLAEVHPLTGRTHQIRVHMAHIGHPVVGDRVYGLRKQRLPCPRQFLHAQRLGFYRPSDGEWTIFFSPLPSDLQEVLSWLEVEA